MRTKGYIKSIRMLIYAISPGGQQVGGKADYPGMLIMPWLSRG